MTSVSLAIAYLDDVSLEAGSRNGKQSFRHPSSTTELLTDVAMDVRPGLTQSGNDADPGSSTGEQFAKPMENHKRHKRCTPIDKIKRCYRDDVRIQ